MYNADFGGLEVLQTFFYTRGITICKLRLTVLIENNESMHETIQLMAFCESLFLVVYLLSRSCVNLFWLQAGLDLSK